MDSETTCSPLVNVSEDSTHDGPEHDASVETFDGSVNSNANKGDLPDGVVGLGRKYVSLIDEILSAVPTYADTPITCKCSECNVFKVNSTVSDKQEEENGRNTGDATGSPQIQYSNEDKPPHSLPSHLNKFVDKTTDAIPLHHSYLLNTPFTLSMTVTVPIASSSSSIEAQLKGDLNEHKVVNNRSKSNKNTHSLSKNDSGFARMLSFPTVIKKPVPDAAKCSSTKLPSPDKPVIAKHSESRPFTEPDMEKAPDALESSPPPSTGPLLKVQRDRRVTGAAAGHPPSQIAGCKRNNNFLNKTKNRKSITHVENIARDQYHQPPNLLKIKTKAALKCYGSVDTQRCPHAPTLTTPSSHGNAFLEDKHTASINKGSLSPVKPPSSTTPQYILTPLAETELNVLPFLSSSLPSTSRAQEKQSPSSNESGVKNRIMKTYRKPVRKTARMSTCYTRTRARTLNSKGIMNTDPEQARSTLAGRNRHKRNGHTIGVTDVDVNANDSKTRTDQPTRSRRKLSCNKKVNLARLPVPLSDPSGSESEPVVVVSSAIPSYAETSLQEQSGRRVTRSTTQRETKTPPIALPRPRRTRKSKRENTGKIRKNLLDQTDAASFRALKEMQITFKKNNVPPKRRNRSPSRSSSRRVLPERRVKGVAQSPTKKKRLAGKISYKVKSKENPLIILPKQRYRHGLKALQSMSSGYSLKEWFEAEPSTSNRAVYATYFRHSKSFVPEHVGDRVTRSKTSEPLPMSLQNTQNVDERSLNFETGELRNLLVDGKLGANFDFNILLRRLDSILDWVKRKNGYIVSDVVIVEILRFDTDDIIENLLHWIQFSDIRKFIHFIQALIKRDRSFKQVIESQLPVFIERMTAVSIRILEEVYARCLLDEALSASAHIFSRKQEWSQQRLAFVMNVIQAMWNGGRGGKGFTSQTEFRRILTKLNIISLLNDGLQPLQLLSTFEDQRITALIRLACTAEAEKKTSILLAELLANCDSILQFENEKLIMPCVINIPPDSSDKKRFKLEKRSDINRKRKRVVENKMKLLRNARETARRTEKEIKELWSNLEFHEKDLIQPLWKAIVNTRTLTQPQTNKTKWVTSLRRRLECVKKSETLTELVTIYHAEFVQEIKKKEFRQNMKEVLSEEEMLELVTQIILPA